MKIFKSVLVAVGLASAFLSMPTLTTHADVSGVSATSTSTKTGTPGGNEPHHVTVREEKTVSSSSLPQTGDASMPLLSVIGVGGLLFVITAISFKKERS